MDNLEDDELWDHYSGLPNPMWYQSSKEEEEESTENKKQIDKLSEQEVLNLKDEEVSSIFSEYNHMSAKRLLKMLPYICRIK